MSTRFLVVTGKRIAILGSTGSIGCNALEVIRHLGAPYSAVALTANRNVERLIEQVEQVRPAAVAVASGAAAGEVLHHISERRMQTRVYVGEPGLCELVERDDVDIVLAAIVGYAGLPPVLAALRAGKRLALANKEALVVAGSILIPLARERGAQILPVDSEHSAVFQAMACGRTSAEIKRVILTASGGPFREWPLERLQNATLADALNHPTWRMGSKVTIDSATMFNKALEVIEACWLFDLPADKIEVVVHPESVVHSMIEFVDGSIIAQLSPPDMRTPIQYALTWPDRRPGVGRTMDWAQAQSLRFEPVDEAKFGTALRLAFDVVRRKGTLGAVLNAANETAVSAFMDGRIAFGMIAPVVERTIARHRLTEEPSLDDLIEADRWARSAGESEIRSAATTD